MNKKYMDFVPAKAKKEVTSKPKVARPVVLKPVEKKDSTRKNDDKLGIIEDLKMVEFEETSVSRGYVEDNGGNIKAIKAKKVGSKEVVSAKPSGLSTKKAEGTYKTPKSPFINQDKVVKRPLSKNVYQKKIEVPKEEPKGPVTIITKPEKQAHVSLIVTIILTIILGAAAGTVAFLLLPK